MRYNCSISVDENGGVSAPPPLTTPVLEVLKMADIDITTQNTTEEWRNIPNAPGYFASSLGRIMSRRHRAARIMSPTRSKTNGYYYVTIHQQRCPVHRLVLEAFVGIKPNGMQCRHLDGNRINNHINNLCWGTPLENSNDQRLHGTLHPRGEKSWLAKLSREQAEEIKNARGSGSSRQVAERFGTSHTTVQAIWRGERWS